MPILAEVSGWVGRWPLEQTLPTRGGTWLTNIFSLLVNSAETPAQEIDLATETMFAELLQRSLDAEFDAEFRENGTFVRNRSKGRLYWHYQWREGEKARNKYVGPVTDPSITDRMKRFATIKTGYERRKTLVRALAATGLATPDALSGMIVEAMWKAGFFFACVVSVLLFAGGIPVTIPRAERFAVISSLLPWNGGIRPNPPRTFSSPGY